ncbi:hypothetical protein [Bradyrhizobium forestalis]|uniref:hypothetical protein n=1 Tax=Bradyrhizobium forestalis TaxID=1419263 RepID=UPI001FE09FC8|nr:hypothetical protein [Bradyrhizobium forestalis]
MAKPETAAGYEKQVKENCERLLVTLVRNLGPWKKSVYLVGGLTPRYVVTKPPPGKQHAGTGDVDAVVEQQVLADTEAYRTLEEISSRWGSRAPRTTRDSRYPGAGKPRPNPAAQSFWNSLPTIPNVAAEKSLRCPPREGISPR